MSLAWVPFGTSLSAQARHSSKYSPWLLIALCCTWQSRAPNTDGCMPEIWPWTLNLTHELDPNLWPWLRPLALTLKQGKSHECQTQFLVFDLNLWPTTLPYIANIAKVKVDLHAKDEGRRSNGSTLRAQTNWRMLPCYQRCKLSLASWSIKTVCF